MHRIHPKVHIFIIPLSLGIDLANLEAIRIAPQDKDKAKLGSRKEPVQGRILHHL